MRIPLALLLCSAFSVPADPAIVGHPGLLPLDAMTLQRIYTGKIVELNGMRVTPVNLPPGNALRAHFLRDYLKQDEDQYIGYWTVRRYVGKGTPPRELENPDAVIEFVSRTTGAIGYVEESRLTPEMKVLLRSAP